MDKEIIKKLVASVISKNLVFDLYDTETEQKLLKNYRREDIEENYASVTSFFEQIKSIYGQNLQIQFKQRNGSRTKNPRPAIDLKATQMQPEVAQQKSIVTNQNNNIGFSGFNGLNVAGLNASDLMTLGAKVNNYDDLNSRYFELKTDFNDLKTENLNLKTENNSLKLKLDTAEERHKLALDKAEINRQGFMDKLVEKVDPQTISMIAPLLMKGKGGAPINSAQGLNEPIDEEINLVVNVMQQSNDAKYIVSQTVKGLQNETFISDLMKLFEQHKIK